MTLRDITMLANYNDEGTVAVCDSVGIQSGLSAAFLNIDGVTISNFGDGIGGAMTVGGSCTPTGTLQNNVFQIRGQNLNVSNSCAGMYGNFSDLHLSDLYFSSNQGPCLSTIPGYGAAYDVTDMRCEYSGGDQYSLKEDGTGIYLDGGSYYHLSNVGCDHTFGACLTLGDGTGTGSDVSLDNITSVDADAGGSAVTNRCQYVINGASDVSATNIQSITDSSVNTPYALCTLGHPNYITWHAVTGASQKFLVPKAERRVGSR